MKTGFNGAGGISGSSVQWRWRQRRGGDDANMVLTPAAVVATAGREGSSVGVGIGVGVGVGVGVSGAGGCCW
jgi:hypothetical protein